METGSDTRFLRADQEVLSGVVRRRGISSSTWAAGHRQPYRARRGSFLRLKYDPATFAKTLNWIVAYGQGNETGVGAAMVCPTRQSTRSSTREPTASISPDISRNRSVHRGRIRLGRKPQAAVWTPQLSPIPQVSAQNRCIRHQYPPRVRADKTSDVLSGLRGCAAGSDQEGRGRSRVRWIESADSRSSS